MRILILGFKTRCFSCHTLRGVRVVVFDEGYGAILKGSTRPSAAEVRTLDVMKKRRVNRPAVISMLGTKLLHSTW
jgi:hypothetical protein